MMVFVIFKKILSLGNLKFGYSNKELRIVFWKLRLDLERVNY